MNNLPFDIFTHIFYFLGALEHNKLILFIPKHEYNNIINIIVQRIFKTNVHIFQESCNIEFTPKYKLSFNNTSREFIQKIIKKEFLYNELNFKTWASTKISI